ncbi:hypothetical protein [Janthinobacterium sp. CG3]|uniref:hypothetical protein n=1 Tax=Janthinobacterium sp. CG3 TaxID=1075768 RepID=UPI001E5219B9|nr:hypothetical protein [Janthinobacterium sp. CG3]
MAFAAAGRHAQVAAQFGHRVQAQINGLADFAIRYVVADTYNHRCTFWLDKVKGESMPQRHCCYCFNENHYHYVLHCPAIEKILQAILMRAAGVGAGRAWPLLYGRSRLSGGAGRHPVRRSANRNNSHYRL